jgi:hypothetical protein
MLWNRLFCDGFNCSRDTARTALPDSPEAVALVGQVLTETSSHQSAAVQALVKSRRLINLNV